MKRKDLTGKKFGRLTVIRSTEKRYNGSIIWECKCECGNSKEVSTVNLKSKNTSSCGCLRTEIDNTTHTLAEWCEIYQQPYTLVRQRIMRDGWDALDALSKPPRQRNSEVK